MITDDHLALPSAELLRWIKADLHLHTADDPYDEIDYTAAQSAYEAALQVASKGFSTGLMDYIR